MRRIVALLMGTALAVAANAQSAQNAKNYGPLQGLSQSAERGGQRLLRDYDANKDGRVTRAEMNNILGGRFAAATRHMAGMSLEQFVVARAAEFHAANEAMFHRLDWSGDGKLTLAEYAAPQHIRFVELDRNGQGYVFCGGDGVARGRLAAFCRENDLDMDGRVTRAELDQALTKRFISGAAKGASMNLAQFVASEEQRYMPTNIYLFRRLDQDGDGLLTIQEYAASETALFARLDKNGNGVLEPSELHLRQTRVASTDQRY